MSNFENDFSFLQDVKKNVMDEIKRLIKEKSAAVDSEVKTGYRRKTESGQGIRLVFPQGVSAARVLLGPEEGWSDEGCGSSDVTVTEAVGRSETVAKSNTVAPLYFVGFIGDTNPESTVSTDLWSLDEELIRELQKHDDILVYCSAERGPGAEWGNLVLFSHITAVGKWRACTTHQKAVSISPGLYSQIRIHRGILKEGLSSERFGIFRTLFVDYALPASDDKHYYIKLWDARGSNSKSYYFCLEPAGCE